MTKLPRVEDATQKKTSTTSKQAWTTHILDTFYMHSMSRASGWSKRVLKTLRHHYIRGASTRCAEGISRPCALLSYGQGELPRDDVDEVESHHIAQSAEWTYEYMMRFTGVNRGSLKDG
jgi:hypothetical protein